MTDRDPELAEALAASRAEVLRLKAEIVRLKEYNRHMAGRRRGNQFVRA